MNFDVDYDKLRPGVYLHSRSGLVTTWDVRLKKPNAGDYLTPECIHTIEHTLSRYMKAQYGDYRVVGVFPMASQTGFYVLTRFIGRTEIIDAINSYAIRIQCSMIIPRNTSKECGQSNFHDMRETHRVFLEFYETYLKYTRTASNYNK